MRLAIKALLVAVCMAFVIAGLPSPRTGTTAGGSGFTGVVSAISQQPSGGDQSPADDETGSERDSRDDVAVTGTAAGRAKDAAEAAVPGATVRRVERETNDDDTPASAYEVELTRPDGTRVEVELNADYKVVGTDREDDGPDDDGPNDD